MQIRVNTGKADLLFVKIPEDSILDGNWQIIGLANEITEEHCEDLVESETDIWLQKMTYNCYTKKDAAYLSAKESFESLMEANEIYSVNPYGKEPEDVPHLGAWTQYRREKWQEWKKAEERTGKWLVLRRI